MASVATTSSVLLVVFVLAVSGVCSVVGRHQREFDYFALALQWPGTYCQRTSHCCPSNGCCQSSVSKTEFTIHGLWPDYNDGSWPSCCSRSNFDIKKISPLLGEIHKYWPSLSCSSTSVCHGGRGLFWAHEWEKHGTCSSPVIKDEYDYFSTVLDLYLRHNITKTLLDSGFIASNDKQYLLGDVVAAVTNAFGASPQLVCKHGDVEEIRICFYKDFKPRDCILTTESADQELNSRSSCPQYISLPKYSYHANTVTWSPDDEYMQPISGLSDI